MNRYQYQQSPVVPPGHSGSSRSRWVADGRTRSADFLLGLRTHWLAVRSTAFTVQRENPEPKRSLPYLSHLDQQPGYERGVLSSLQITSTRPDAIIPAPEGNDLLAVERVTWRRGSALQCLSVILQEVPRCGRWCSNIMDRVLKAEDEFFPIPVRFFASIDAPTKAQSLKHSSVAYN